MTAADRPRAFLGRDGSDSQASTTPAGLGLDGVPIEPALGRPATDAGSRPPVFRGLVPGGVAPGTAAPFPADPHSNGDGAALNTVPGARVGSAAPGAGQQWHPLAARGEPAPVRCPECRYMSDAPGHRITCGRAS